MSRLRAADGWGEIGLGDLLIDLADLEAHHRLHQTNKHANSSRNYKIGWTRVRPSREAHLAADDCQQPD